MKLIRENIKSNSFQEFNNIKRYWDPAFDCYVAKILPGEYYLTQHPECITTVVGSCISVCARDVSTGIGGMNHFMLPAKSRDDLTIVSDATRYGNYAMEYLINSILSRGGHRGDLEFKIFGGGHVLHGVTHIGQINIDFILKYMSDEGFSINSKDLGDIYPRKILYFPKTGRVLIKKLKGIDQKVVTDRDKQYLDALKKFPVAGDIELF